MPYEYQSRFQWIQVLLAAAMAAVVVGMQVSGRETAVVQVYPILAASLLVNYLHSWRLISDGVLILINGFGGAKMIPLATAEAVPKGKAIQIRWQEGRFRRAAAYRFGPQFADTLLRSVEAARSSPPGSLPGSAIEAKRLVSIGAMNRLTFWQWLALVGTLVSAGAGLVTETPILLLPLASLPLMPWLTARLAMLTREGLWILNPGSPPHLIPMAAVRSYQMDTTYLRIHTADPTHPVVEVNRFHASDLERRLKRHLQGEGEPASPASVALETNASETALRCTLCGSPVGRAAAGADSVTICDRCADRTRYEALEGGHGPAAKGPKQM